MIVVFLFFWQSGKQNINCRVTIHRNARCRAIQPLTSRIFFFSKKNIRFLLEREQVVEFPASRGLSWRENKASAYSLPVYREAATERAAFFVVFPVHERVKKFVFFLLIVVFKVSSKYTLPLFTFYYLSRSEFRNSFMLRTISFQPILSFSKSAPIVSLPFLKSTQYYLTIIHLSGGE